MNLLVIVFLAAPKNGTSLGGEGSGVGGQDRVGSPHVNQEILGPTLPHPIAPLAKPRDHYL